MRALITDPDDVSHAVRTLADGGAVAYGFANFYALASRPDAEVVRSMNLMKGRPAGQVGSVTTTPSRGPSLFDWSAMPAGLTRGLVLAAMDALFSLGPCGFRGPAASHVPAHLARIDDGVRTVQLIGPGYACASNHFVTRALRAIDDDLLYITSANRSHHLTGAPEEPAHYRAGPLAEEFATQQRFCLLAHADDEVARRRYPSHVTTSVTVLSWHTAADPDSAGRPTLVIERHGSLGLGDVARALSPLGLAVRLAPNASERLRPRRYE